jgi:hypothetical protein
MNANDRFHEAVVAVFRAEKELDTWKVENSGYSSDNPFLLKMEENLERAKHRENTTKQEFYKVQYDIDRTLLSLDNAILCLKNAKNERGVAKKYGYQLMQNMWLTKLERQKTGFFCLRTSFDH